MGTFADAIQTSVDPVTDMTLRVYENVINGPLKPIPRKSHYTFNLRDISKIFQGVCSASNTHLKSKADMARLWIHENKRVFGDRLIDDEDRDWLNNLLDAEATTALDLKREEIYNSERLVFGDFMAGLEAEPRIYCQIADLKLFISRIVDYLSDFNAGTKSKMRLVMFLEACDHVARIARCIRNPLGNAFLLGVGGSGRQSLSKLATFLCNYKINQIEIVKGYGMANWRDDVKKALLQCGIENKATTFLFVDTQIVDEQMLEDINGILNAGDIPNLYKVEDQELIFDVGKKECISKGITVNKMNMFGQFLARVKSNIHMVIAMSPLGDVFRTRLRMFPSLVNCCTLDWFTEWPEEALVEVAKGYLTDNDLDLGDHLLATVQVFKTIHQSVEKKSVEFTEELRRFNYVTPTSYLELLSLYETLLVKKRADILFAQGRLEKGLQVLAEAAVEIDTLKDMLDRKQPELEKTKANVEKTKIKLAKDKAEADKERQVVAAEEAEATQQEA